MGNILFRRMVQKSVERVTQPQEFELSGKQLPNSFSITLSMVLHLTSLNILGFLCITISSTNFFDFSSFIFSFLTLLFFFCAAKLSTLVSIVNCGIIIFPFLALNCNSLYTSTNCALMFSPLNSPIFITLNLTSPLARNSCHY